MSISAQDVKKLRDQTGAGMMDCKKALAEANGDMEKAVEILRKKGQKVSEKRADREANQGLILSKVSEDGHKAAMLEINCETDFVARNEDFQDQASKFLDLLYNHEFEATEDLLSAELDGISVAAHLESMVGKIGEKIEISRTVFLKDSEKNNHGLHPPRKSAWRSGRICRGCRK